ncbi:hypothetical protein [Dyella sp. GSA-30]|uniref:hypothetical protein n=1 Tax=Dyella sp. GSA-30 TaxID=2994496 RepID=UPI00248F6277|nr:hypothetical protein [Dyella sp. GSA-30]BDU22434.1 hypothetical protein DYGSA30_38910 [Dyella sp. GSA-30]
MPHQHGKSAKASGKTTPKHPSPKQRRYEARYDRTLTASQGKAGSFRDNVVDSVSTGKSITKGAFRSPSNPTRRGFSSGYHESYLVTDAVDQLSRRKVGNKQGFSSLPKNTRGYWKKHSGAKFPEKALRAALKAGDGARTDTARTILSAPRGGSAGHSGSGVHTGSQSQAHDLLRDQSIRALSDPKISPEAQGVIAGLTTVWSIAPGKHASRVKNAAKLKDSSAKSSWEEDRNEAKLRVRQSFRQLPKKDQKRVLKHEENFFKSLGDTTRKRSRNEPGSPLRETGSRKGNAIHGGDYFAKSSKSSSSKRPRLDPPSKASPRDTALYITEPFRVKRQ